MTEANPLLALPLLQHGQELKSFFILSAGKWMSRISDSIKNSSLLIFQPTNCSCSPQQPRSAEPWCESCERQQRGHQMLTFTDGSRNSPLLFLLSVPLIPFGRNRGRSSSSDSLWSFWLQRCVSVTSLSRVFSVYSNVHLLFSLSPDVHFGLRTSSSSTFTAKFCEMDMLFQNQEIYSKQYKELPKLHTRVCLAAVNLIQNHRAEFGPHAPEMLVLLNWH